MAQVRAHNINVNHVAISVPDATLAADWYVEHLGFYRVIADDTVTRDNARSGDADQIGFKSMPVSHASVIRSAADRHSLRYRPQQVQDCLPRLW